MNAIKPTKNNISKKIIGKKTILNHLKIKKKVRYTAYIS